MEIPKIIDEGKNVAYLYKITGTHIDDFMQISATGRKVSFRGMTMLTMEDGKCTEA